MPRQSEVVGGDYSKSTNWDDRIPNRSPAIIGIHQIRIRHGEQVDSI